MLCDYFAPVEGPVEYYYVDRSEWSSQFCCCIGIVIFEGIGCSKTPKSLKIIFESLGHKMSLVDLCSRIDRVWSNGGRTDGDVLLGECLAYLSQNSKVDASLASITSCSKLMIKILEFGERIGDMDVCVSIWKRFLSFLKAHHGHVEDCDVLLFMHYLIKTGFDVIRDSLIPLFHNATNVSSLEPRQFGLVSFIIQRLSGSYAFWMPRLPSNIRANALSILACSRGTCLVYGYTGDACSKIEYFFGKLLKVPESVQDTTQGVVMATQTSSLSNSQTSSRGNHLTSDHNPSLLLDAVMHMYEMDMFLSSDPSGKAPFTCIGMAALCLAELNQCQTVLTSSPEHLSMDAKTAIENKCCVFLRIIVMSLAHLSGRYGGHVWTGIGDDKFADLLMETSQFVHNLSLQCASNGISQNGSEVLETYLLQLSCQSTLYGGASISGIETQIARMILCGYLKMEEWKDLAILSQRHRRVLNCLIELVVLLLLDRQGLSKHAMLVSIGKTLRYVMRTYTTPGNHQKSRQIRSFIMNRLQGLVRRNLSGLELVLAQLSFTSEDLDPSMKQKALSLREFRSHHDQYGVAVSISKGISYAILLAQTFLSEISERKGAILDLVSYEEDKVIIKNLANFAKMFGEYLEQVKVDDDAIMVSLNVDVYRLLAALKSLNRIFKIFRGQQSPMPVMKGCLGLCVKVCTLCLRVVKYLLFLSSPSNANNIDDKMRYNEVLGEVILSATQFFAISTGTLNKDRIGPADEDTILKALQQSTTSLFTALSELESCADSSSSHTNMTQYCKSVAWKMKVSVIHAIKALNLWLPSSMFPKLKSLAPRKYLPCLHAYDKQKTAFVDSKTEQATLLSFSTYKCTDAQLPADEKNQFDLLDKSQNAQIASWLESKRRSHLTSACSHELLKKRLNMAVEEIERDNREKENVNAQGIQNRKSSMVLQLQPPTMQNMSGHVQKKAKNR